MRQALLMVLLVGGFIEAAGESPVGNPVKTAITNFEPLWRPADNALCGLVIGVDPAGVGCNHPGECLCDQLSLLTAGHLYHFVLAGRGSPAMTRADETLAVDPDGNSLSRRLAIVREAKCDVCVSVRYVAGDGPAGVGAGAGNEHERLVTALRDALDTPGSASVSETCDSDLVEALSRDTDTSGVPACVVQFPGVVHGASLDAAARKMCFDNARRLYDGIACFCSPRACDDDPTPVPDCPPPGPTERQRYPGRQIWPAGDLPDEQLTWFCRTFAKVSITNRSLACFEVSARRDGDQVVLEGRTNIPSAVEGLQKALGDVGISKTRNDVRALPDAERLGGRIFGICRAPSALTYNRPADRGGLQTQMLFGEPLFLLDCDDEWFLLQTGDGYWGWVRREAVEPLDAQHFDAYMSHPRAAMRRDFTLPEPTMTGQRIPRGAVVAVARLAGERAEIVLPDGSTASVPAEALRILDADGAVGLKRAQAALDMLYAPYVFGGRSPLGLDCSGLITNAGAQIGELPPRDAWHQTFAGSLVATHWHRAGIRVGDLLFFINSRGKVYNVGVALDATHVVHSSPPCVRISSIDPKDRLYSEELDRAFFVAKRP